jgi:hypothetical protein
MCASSSGSMHGSKSVTVLVMEHFSLYMWWRCCRGGAPLSLSLYLFLSLSFSLSSFGFSFPQQQLTHGRPKTKHDGIPRNENIMKSPVFQSFLTFYLSLCISGGGSVAACLYSTPINERMDKTTFALVSRRYLRRRLHVKDTFANPGNT